MTTKLERLIALRELNFMAEAIAAQFIELKICHAELLDEDNDFMYYINMALGYTRCLGRNAVNEADNLIEELDTGE